MKKIIVLKAIVLAFLIFNFGCSTGKKEKIINPITLVKKGHTISARANESFYGGEVIINQKIKAENIEAGENIPEISVQTIKDKTIIKFVTNSSEVVAGEEIFSLNNCNEEVVIFEVSITDSIETKKIIKRK